MKKRVYPLFFASNRYIRASVYERTYQKLSLDSLKNRFLRFHILEKLRSHVENRVSTERSEQKSFMSEANSELLLLFSKVTKILTKKLPQRIERKRDSIEFERSENQGQFFMIQVFNYFKVFKCFSTCYKPYSSMFSEYI